MWKRLAAAAVAVVLAAVGMIMVISYARGADERALAGLETQSVLMAKETIAEGTAVEDISDLVEERSVPRDFVVPGALEELQPVQGQIVSAPIAAGEQLHRGRFATAEELRVSGAAPLPEEAKDLHQVTVAMDKTRALGGNVAAGDRVGVFMSFETKGQSGYVLNRDGSVERVETSPEDESSSASEASITTTHLTQHKVLVVRVEGGHVASASADQDDTEAEGTVEVTLALDAPDAERLVFAMEWGTVWLSLEPEGASEDGTGVVVATIPDEARNVYQ